MHHCNKPINLLVIEKNLNSFVTCYDRLIYLHSQFMKLNDYCDFLIEKYKILFKIYYDSQYDIFSPALQSKSKL